MSVNLSTRQVGDVSVMDVTGRITLGEEGSGRLRKALQELRRHVETHCDYVGERFAEEARRIHYGERDPRGIYGEASADDAKDLADEGIEVSRIPWLPPTDA